MIGGGNKFCQEPTFGVVEARKNLEKKCVLQFFEIQLSFKKPFV